MAKDSALTLSIKIAGKMDSSLTAAIAGTTKGLSGLTSTLGKIGKAGIAAMTAVATATVGVLSKCTEEAANFANAMGDVTKYVGGLADESGQISDEISDNGKTYKENYEETKNALLYMGTQIPYSPEDLTVLAAAGGQSGWTREQMIDEGYLRDAAKWGAAMDIDAKTAGDYAAKWEHAFQFTHDQVMDLADVINYLGAHNSTTAAEIANVVNRSASIGQLAGMDPKATAAVATIVLESGVAENRAATSINRIYSNFMAGDSASKAMMMGWDTLGMDPVDVAKGMIKNAPQTMATVFGKINELPEYQRAAVIKNIIGQWAFEAGSKFGGNLDKFSQLLADVGNPETYTGSMEKEFNIKSATPAAAKMMYDAAWQQLEVHIGDTFLPAQTKLTLGMRDILVELDAAVQDMPELQELSDDLVTLATDGIRALSNALVDALPYIKDGVAYLVHNGPEVAKMIRNLFLTFLGMSVAPQIQTAVTGVGGLLGTAILGKNTISQGRQGGLLGLFRGGQKAATSVTTTTQNVFKSAQMGAQMANSATLTGAVPAATGIKGRLGAMSNSILGGIIGVQSMGTLMDTKSSDKKYMKGFAGVVDKVTQAKASGGLRGFVGRALANTGPGKYFTGIGNSAKNLKSSAGGLGQATWGMVRAILPASMADGIQSMGTGIKTVIQEDIARVKNFGLSALTGAKNLGGKALTAGVSGVKAAGSAVMGAIPVPVMTKLQGAGRFVADKAGAVKAFGGRLAGAAIDKVGMIGTGARNLVGAGMNFAGAGAGLIGSAWSPVSGIFGNLITGAAPVVAAIGGIIAIVSILGDHLEDIRSLVDRIFGEKGVKVFDAFTGKLQQVGDFMSNLFKDGGLQTATNGIREKLVGALGDNPDMSSYVGAFDGIITIGQSILGVIQQIVQFGTGVVKPIIQEIFGFITQTVLPGIANLLADNAPMIAQIISGLGNAVMGCMNLIGQAIQFALPFVGAIIQAIMQIGSVVIPAILGAFNQFVEGLNTVIEAAKTIFDGLIQFLTGVFTGNWRAAWEGVKQIFGGIFDALAGLVKAPLNAVISIINGVLDRIDGINFTVPDWVPVLGGRQFSLNIPRIPMLAQGGFTTGPSIAGEAGQEAVISFQRGVRTENIDTWIRAGQVLGVGATEAIQAVPQNERDQLPTPKQQQVSLEILKVPMFAKGGFTSGPGIAGEAGQEAVISFQSGVRTENINTWIRAGQMLGVGNREAAQAASLSNREYRREMPVRSLDLEDDSGAVGNRQTQITYTYSPNITIQGNADRDVIDQALRDSERRWEQWLTAREKDARRRRY